MIFTLSNELADPDAEPVIGACNMPEEIDESLCVPIRTTNGNVALIC